MEMSVERATKNLKSLILKGTPITLYVGKFYRGRI